MITLTIEDVNRLQEIIQEKLENDNKNLELINLDIKLAEILGELQ